MSKRTAVFYTIHVLGHLDPSWSSELNGLVITTGPDGTTRLTGQLADQAALLGCLNRLVSLGAELLSVESETVQATALSKGKVNMLQAQATTLEAEKAQILAQIDKVQQGWNSGNGTLFAEPFTEDADYTVWNGIYAKGQAVIAEQHQHIFDTFYANTTLHYGKKHIRFLRDDVALVRFEHAFLTRENGEHVREGGVRPLMVFVKNDGEWRITLFQNTPIITE